MANCRNCGAPLNGSWACPMCGAAQGGGFNQQSNMGFGGGGMGGFGSNSNQTRVILFWVGAIAAAIVSVGIFINAIIFISKVAGMLAEARRYARSYGFSSYGFDSYGLSSQASGLQAASIIGFILYIALVGTCLGMSLRTIFSGRKNVYNGNKLGIVTSISMLVFLIICLIIRAAIEGNASALDMDNLGATMIMALIACVPGFPGGYGSILGLMDFAVLGLVLYGVSLAAHIISNKMVGSGPIGGGYGGGYGGGGYGGGGYGGGGYGGGYSGGGNYNGGGGFEGSIF